MKTQIWNRTTIVWAIDHVLPKETNIPIYTVFNSEPEFHKLTHVSAYSLPERGKERKGIIQTSIPLNGNGSNNEQHENIIARLQTVDDVLKVSDGGSFFASSFSILYKLKDGESFCDSALRKVGQLLEKLGIDDEKKLIVCNFIPFQETLVKTNSKGWIPYGDYLRAKHGLPQVCTMHKRTINLANGLKLKMDYTHAQSNLLQRSLG